MRLPLRTVEHYTGTLVVDAKGKILMRLSSSGADLKTARAIVRKLNRTWRYVLFGQQPYEYTREDWLFERNPGVKAP